VLAGFLLGLAATARLPLVFAAPGSCSSVAEGTRPPTHGLGRGGGILPVGALLQYTLAHTGPFLHRATTTSTGEAWGYPSSVHPSGRSRIPATSRRTAESCFGAALLAPDVKPDTLGSRAAALCAARGRRRGLFDRTVRLAMPVESARAPAERRPGLLALLVFRRRPIVPPRFAAAAVAVVPIALFNLALSARAGSSGIRFSLDFTPSSCRWSPWAPPGRPASTGVALVLVCGVALVTCGA